MSELASYSIQAVFFALVAVVVVSRSKKTDLYQFALIAIWLVGVVIIYAKYKEDQIYFYSNDQLWHFRIIDYYLPQEGLSLEGIIGLRYLLTVPIYLVSLTGFDAMLAIKFIQLSALLAIYSSGKRYLEALDLRIKFWCVPLMTGPLLLFMSLLSLRDVILAYFAILFTLRNPIKFKILPLLFMFLLRPHLGVSMAFGFILAQAFVHFKPRFKVLNLFIFSLGSYVIGSISYWIGALIQQGVSLQLPTSVFSQIKVARLVANFMGLQFLTLRDNEDLIVSTDNSLLFLSRIIFFETVAIPLLFLICVFRSFTFNSVAKIQTLLGFIFFYGIVSQTTWNSTRQNIPFLICMGVLAVADIEYFRKIKAKVPAKLFRATQ
jgi:hypothetical protein